MIGLGFLTSSAINFVPNHAHKIFAQRFAALGFSESITLPEPDKRLSAIRYTNIELDASGRSYIDQMTLHYTIPDLLLGGTFTSLDIKDLFLSGDVNANGDITLSGFENPSALLNINQSHIGIITLKDATLSLLSAQLGGIRIAASMQIKNEDGKTTWTGNLESIQDQLELLAKINGQILNDQDWQNDIEIENAKIERDIGKLTRMSGTASFYGTGKEITKITSDLKAGGMQLMQLPWQNVSIAANGTPSRLTMFISGQSVGINDLELGFEGVLKNKALAWNARIFAPSIKTASEYLSLQNIFIIPKNLLDDIETSGDVELVFTQKEDKAALSIKDATENKTLKTFALEQNDEL